MLINSLTAMNHHLNLLSLRTSVREMSSGGLDSLASRARLHFHRGTTNATTTTDFVWPRRVQLFGSGDGDKVTHNMNKL